MIYCRINYPCRVCGNKRNWYIMPEDEITKSRDVVRSNTKFIIQCKKCGQSYRLIVNLKKIEKRVKDK